MKRVGITGGIGSGKTTVCEIFESLDIPIYYADIRAKKIMSGNLSVKRQIKSILGEDAYFRNGKPNRKYIGDKIFNDKKLLEAINQIVHPEVHHDAERWMSDIGTKGSVPYVLKEAALLVENKSYKSLDALIVVTCPEEIRIARVMKRDRLTYDEVLRKVKNQLAESEITLVADFIIVNDGLHPLIPQIIQIHKKLSKK